MATLPKLVQSDTPNKYRRATRPDKVKPVRLIVPHTAEGSYAGTVSWLRNPDSQASSHIVLNDRGDEATQLVGWEDRAWTQQAFNPEAISIEVSGRLSTRWLNPIRAAAQQRRLARIVAFLLRRNGLPNHWVRNAERFSGRGYTRHGDLMPEGGHPLCLIYKWARWRAFRAMVTWEYRRRGFRQDWGRD